MLPFPDAVFPCAKQFQGLRQASTHLEQLLPRVCKKLRCHKLGAADFLPTSNRLRTCPISISLLLSYVLAHLVQESHQPRWTEAEIGMEGEEQVSEWEGRISDKAGGKL